MFCAQWVDVAPGLYDYNSQPQTLPGAGHDNGYCELYTVHTRVTPSPHCYHPYRITLSPCHPVGIRRWDTHRSSIVHVVCVLSCLLFVQELSQSAVYPYA